MISLRDHFAAVATETDIWHHITLVPKVAQVVISGNGVRSVIAVTPVNVRELARYLFADEMIRAGMSSRADAKETAENDTSLQVMENMDACVFSSDMLFTHVEIEKFKVYLDRWNKAVSEHTPISDDTTCGMCHGTGEGQRENSFCPNCLGGGIA